MTQLAYVEPNPAGTAIALAGFVGHQLWQARFIPAEAEACAGAPLTVIAHPVLLRLLRASFAALPHVTVAEWASGLRVGHVNEARDAGAGAPYLRVPRLGQPAEPAGLHVGVCWWAGGRPSDECRALLATLVEPLLALPGLTLHALHLGSDPTDLSAYPEIRTVPLADCYDAAQLAVQMDVIVSVDAHVHGDGVQSPVDSSLSHVAGALGVPTLAVSRSWAADHRYASLRVYRGVTQIAGDVGSDEWRVVPAGEPAHADPLGKYPNGGGVPGANPRHDGLLVRYVRLGSDGWRLVSVDEVAHDPLGAHPLGAGVLAGVPAGHPRQSAHVMGLFEQRHPAHTDFAPAIAAAVAAIRAGDLPPRLVLGE